MRVIASSGTELVGYYGYRSSADVQTTPHDLNKWDAIIQFDPAIGSKEVQFFFPYTTTLIELRLNREPMPLTGINKVFWFLQDHS